MSLDVLISSRISFSHDIDLSEHDSGATLPSSSPTSIEDDFDFAFSVDGRGALIRESSTADELFSDGKLLPASINFATSKEINNLLEQEIQSFQSCSASKKQGSEYETKILKSLKEHLEDSTDFEDEESEGESTGPRETVSRTFGKLRRSLRLNVGRNKGKQSVPSKLTVLSRSRSTGLLRKTLTEETYVEEGKHGLPTLMEDEKSFWKFKRSNSLDSDKIGKNRGGGIIGSLKMKFQRSNSTGEESRQFRIRRSSSLNCSRQSKRLIIGRSKSTGSAYTENKELLKQSSTRSSSSPLKKGQRHGRTTFKDYHAIFYRGERVNPLMNLPSPYISRASVDLLGFGSLFCNGRHRKKRN